MAKYNFNLRDPKASESAIHLVIRWNNNRLVYPTGETISTKFWENDKKKRNFQRAKEVKQFPEYPEFNERLDKLERGAKEVFRRFQIDNNNVEPTPDQLRDLLHKHFNKGVTTPIGDLIGFAEQYISQVESSKKKSTVIGYNNSVKHLKEYQTKIRKKLTFDKITVDFYLDFTDFLVKEKGFKPNTVGKQIKNIKLFMTAATERRLNTNLEFKSKRFKVLTEETDAVYLNDAELQDLYKLDLSEMPKLERVRDLFLVGCYTGLRFSDLSQLKKEHIKNGNITIKAQKTNDVVIIPVHKVVAEVLKKYKDVTPNGLPPALSNQKMNEYLKDIAERAKLNDSVIINETHGNLRAEVKMKKYDLITTHTARRSFATNLYLSGFPSIEIRRITGHKTEAAFLKYIKVDGEQVATRLRDHWNKQSKLRIA